MKRVTIQDIASELKLSRNTVSKALSGGSAVSRETREIIVRKAVEMGYPTYRITIPEELRQSIKPETKKNILILSRRETTPFWNRMIMGISDVVNERQDTIQLRVVSDEDEHDGYIPSEYFDNVDGVIIISVFETDFVKKLMRSGVPAVFFDAPVHSEIFLDYGDVILPEGINSVRLLVDRLITQGLRRFSFIGDITYCKSIYDRYIGFVSALSENGITADPDIMFISHKPGRYYSSDEVVEAIEKCPYTPDAIICANDNIAVDVCAVLKNRGLSVPRDVAVAGFDNDDSAGLMTPSLTSVDVNAQSIGRKLASKLYSRISDPGDTRELICVRTEVLQRESTKRRKLF